MAQPEWITPAGSLGSIPEGVFYQLTLLASSEPLDLNIVCTATSSVTNRITCNSTAGIYAGLNVVFGGVNGVVFGGLDPLVRYFVLAVHSSTEFSVTTTENSTTPVALTTASGTMPTEFSQHILFKLQAGQLPAGIQVSDNGLIVGVPKAVASLQGVPAPVNKDVTSKFVIRAYTKKLVGSTLVLDQLRDRTFEITVTGPNPPAFITPPGQIAQFYDGVLVTDLQVEYTDPDLNDTAVIQLVSGSLPQGLSISSTGKITGYVVPLSPIDATAGFSRDGQGFDEYSFDFSTQSFNSNYEFTLELTDGIYSTLRTFSIYVYSKNSLTADNTDITSDNTFITADVTSARPPIVFNPQGSIGTVRNDNWYAYQFIGLDPDGDQFSFSLTGSIPGLTLDPKSGWLYGYIPDLGLTEETYDFSVTIFKDINPTDSNTYSYSLNITGAVDTDVTWLTPSNLGTIDNGAVSLFYVAAVNVAGIPLQYRLVSGSNSNLPQGLQLLPSGNIAGRVSFNTFALDLGTTTFDVTQNDLGIASQNTETTFDATHSFLVQAFSVDGLISTSKRFSITVNRAYNEPYDNLYIQAMPPEVDRNLVLSLLQNADIFQPQLLYRPDDPNFGRANNVIYYHAYGLTAATLADYVSSLYLNHYWKTVTLGSIKVAQARNAAGEVIYEAVYSQVVDNLVNDEGLSVSKEVTLPYPLDNNTVTTVYPNSLPNMRDQVIDVVGRVSNVLPLWMTSKQANGKVLGFTPAWVLAYAKPGQGERLAYYIKTKFGERLNLVDFEIDRYELDKLLSKNWDSAAQTWIPTPPDFVTFDTQNHYELPVPNDSSLAFNGGSGYEIGDIIRIYGNQVGGTAGTNDITIVVETVDTFGTITQARASGFAPLLSTGNTYINVVGTNIIGTGTGATWDIVVVGADPTTFDGNSMQFTAPVDMYSNTTDYDKYLVFPKRTILG